MPLLSAPVLYFSQCELLGLLPFTTSHSSVYSVLRLTFSLIFYNTPGLQLCHVFSVISSNEDTFHLVFHWVLAMHMGELFTVISCTWCPVFTECSRILYNTQWSMHERSTQTASCHQTALHCIRLEIGSEGSLLLKYIIYVFVFSLLYL